MLPIASTHAFVAAGRGATFITFAGTDPVVLANWISDFDTHLTSTGVAAGYAEAASIVLDRIKEMAEKRPNNENKLFLGGHSLGGALAVVTASRLAPNAPTPVDAVYTFGMPRPGSGDFARDYNADLGMRTYRLIHGGDLVPTVAPSEMGFRHVGRYLHCARRGRFDEQDLVADTLSDDPPFVRGVASEIRDFLHSPFGATSAAATQLRLAAEMALGKVRPGKRTDPGGILIELLPLRIRDHMPDRYCRALQRKLYRFHQAKEGPRVRILLPPAASQVRTRLSREYAFLRREAAVFPGLPLVHFSDSRCGSAAELRSVIVRARRLARDDAERERAAAAVKTWLLAQIEKKRAAPASNVVEMASDAFVPERLAA